MNPTLQDRIVFNGDIKEVVLRAAEYFDIGQVESIEPIFVGFQDYNVKVKTKSEYFLLKIFSKSRDDADVKRYVSMMEAALGAGVHHPSLKTKHNHTVYYDKLSDLFMVMMDFINGHTFYDLKRSPTISELQLVAIEALKISNITYSPTEQFDSWAIPNISWMYGQTRTYLTSSGKLLIESVLEKFNAIDLKSLPKCFVHGDIIKTNTLLFDNKIFILDFAVSNIYPRIQELAVMAANLMYDGNTTLKERTDRVVDAYLKVGGLLTKLELEILYDYALAGTAMEMMGGYYEKYVMQVEGDEINYWIQLGTEGLTAALKGHNL